MYYQKLAIFPSLTPVDFTVAVTLSVMNENSISTNHVLGSSTAEGHVKRNQIYVKRQFQQSMLLQALLITFIIINVMVMTIFWAMDYFADLQQI